MMAERAFEQLALAGWGAEGRGERGAVLVLVVWSSTRLILRDYCIVVADSGPL